MPVDEYMKSIGYPTGGKAAGAPAAKADASEKYQGILAPGPLEGVQRGIAKGAAELGVGAGRLAGKGVGLLSPSTQESLGNLAERVPGVKRLEAFADRPYADPGELSGSLGLTALSGAAAERGIASGLANVVDRFTPLAEATRTRGLGQFAGNKLRMVPTTAGQVTKYAAPVAGAVGAGAAGGAAGDPEDPVTGAEIGAATSFMPPGVSKVLRSRVGTNLGGHIARSIAGHAVPAALGGAAGYAYGGPRDALIGAGVASGMRHSVVSYHSPTGRWLTKFGHGLFDRAGKLVGWINPLTGGFIASSVVASGASPSDYLPSAAPAAEPSDEEQ
jgi:hypothetical protein